MRYFEDNGEEDLAAMVEGVEFGRSIYASISPPLGPFVENFPCTKANCSTKDAIKAQIWSHHATGSCAIGADDDPMAVLGSRFRVRGVEELRVVDASVWPIQPGGFPILPTFMVSEKAAAVIIEDARRRD